MRRHAKASTAGSTQRQAGRPGLAVGGVLGVLLLTFFALAVSPALGATVTERPLLFSFDGSSLPGGPLKGAYSVAYDYSSGAVYVGESEGQDANRLYRFHADGTPWNFSSTGVPWIESVNDEPLGLRVAVAVDNSGGPNQGRIYETDTNQQLNAFDPSGELLWTTRPPDQASDVAVDTQGHPYVATPGTGFVREYSNTGSPPVLINSFSTGGAVRALDLDTEGDDFLSTEALVGGEVIQELRKWVGGVNTGTFAPGDLTGVSVDQTSAGGHVFAVHRGANERQAFAVDATAGQFRLSVGGYQTPDLSFDASRGEIKAALEGLPPLGRGNIQLGEPSPRNFEIVYFNENGNGLLEEANLEQVACEDGTVPLSGGSGCTATTSRQGESSSLREYAPDGTLLGTFGVGILSHPRAGIAYAPGSDRVYALQEGQHPLVAVFGPSVTGTVADVTIESPSSVGVIGAHFSGTVNPQGTSSEWRFQWRRAGQSWIDAPSSPPQSLPADSSPHTVEYTTEALRGGTAYQVRLVAVNTANQLVGASPTQAFTTPTAAHAPAVTIDAPSAIAAGGAKITGTINPQGDIAEWRVQISTDPACSAGFENQQLQTTQAANTPVDVEYELTGLLPSQTYCARIVATNSAGETTSETKTFETADALPTQVFTAYAAPRTDTTARLNALVNPEGSEATYRFEYSSDGSNWTALPDLNSPRSRKQLVVAEEVSGLQPSMNYHYRVTIENGAGPVQGGEKTFLTRSTTEMQLAKRGIELVSKPDKGNQNLGLQRPLGEPSMVSSGGNAVLWNLFSGAPEGNSGTEVNFLAKRTPSGWVNRAVAPPAAQQVGEGGYAYHLEEATPDFKHFVFRAARSGVLAEGEPSFVRLDDEQHQEVLKALPQTFGDGSALRHSDVTDNALHVLLGNPESGQLEEIGDPSEVVSIMPDGTPSECGVGIRGFTGDGAGIWRAGYHRMDVTDASRVYFETVPNGGPCEDRSQEALFFRDRDADQTTEVASHVEMIRATPDGRHFYFRTSDQLESSDNNSKADIYRWDAESGDYTCLTCVVSEAAVDGVLISDDFSHIYFSSQKLLVPGHGVPGEDHLYVLSGGVVKYIASTGEPGSGASDLQRTALSHNGNVMVIATLRGHGELTADRLAPECRTREQEGLGKVCEEFYRYEDSTESLECLSCEPGRITERSAGSPGVESYFAMSEDGNTVAFVTPAKLLPEDINGTYDIYGWHNGAVQLISDGETIYPERGLGTSPKVYGIDASGENIFFSLLDSNLTGYEQDRLSNLYDARVGGGFPRPQEAVHCIEESCQGATEAAPSPGIQSSTVFQGEGNVKAPSKRKTRCARKRGRARSRCLRRNRHHHKRHHHKRHSRQAAKHNAGGSK